MMLDPYLHFSSPLSARCFDHPPLLLAKMLRGIVVRGHLFLFHWLSSTALWLWHWSQANPGSADWENHWASFAGSHGRRRAGQAVGTSACLCGTAQCRAGWGPAPGRTRQAIQRGEGKSDYVWNRPVRVLTMSSTEGWALKSAEWGQKGIVKFDVLESILVPRRTLASHRTLLSYRPALYCSVQLEQSCSSDLVNSGTWSGGQTWQYCAAVTQACSLW